MSPVTLGVWQNSALAYTFEVCMILVRFVKYWNTIVPFQWPLDQRALNRGPIFVKIMCRFDGDLEDCTERRWSNGALEEDLPITGLSQMFNVNYCLVSQASPYIAPVLTLKKYVNHTVVQLVEHEWNLRQTFLHLMFQKLETSVKIVIHLKVVDAYESLTRWDIKWGKLVK